MYISFECRVKRIHCSFCLHFVYVSAAFALKATRFFIYGHQYFMTRNAHEKPRETEGKRGRSKKCLDRRKHAVRWESKLVPRFPLAAST